MKLNNNTIWVVQKSDLVKNGSEWFLKQLNSNSNVGYKFISTIDLGIQVWVIFEEIES